MINYTLGLLFSEDKKQIVLILKNRPWFHEGLYNAPGGKIEEYETPLENVQREIYEETGVVTNLSDWEEVLRYPGKEGDGFKEIFVYKTTTDLTKAFTKEDQPVTIFNIDQLPDNTVPNLKWIINAALTN